MRKHLKYIILFFVFFSITPIIIGQNNSSDEDEKLAAIYFNNGEYEKAVVIYEKLYNKKPNQFNYDYYFQCLIKLDDFKGAEKLVKKEIKRNPDNQKFKVELGYVYSLSGQKQKAEKEYEQAIKKMPNNQQLIIDLANAFIVRKEENYAIRVYEKGRKLLKASYGFNLELADIYESKGEYTKMMNEYINLLDENFEYMADIQSKLQLIISDDVDGKKSEALKNLLLEKTQKHPSSYLYPEMLFWYSIQKKDFELALVQAKSLDRRYNEEGERVFQLAGIIASNKEYDIAIKAYNYIIKMGDKNFLYLSSKIRMLDVKYQKITTTKNFTKEDLVVLEKDFVSTIEELGKDASIIPILKNLAHMQAFYLDKTDDAIKLLEEALAFKNAPPMDLALCKIELADILLMSGNQWEATLLYSQVEKAFKNEPIGHLAKFKNAKLSFYIGEFEWAKAQLDVLKAATSKLIANDAMELSLLINDNVDEDSTYIQLIMFARADLLFFKNKDKDALATLDTIADYFPNHQINDEILYKKAEIYLSKSNYKKAAENLQKIVDNYSFDILADDALFMLADLYENQFAKPEKAKEYYQKILLDYPGSLYTVEARKRFRKLREGQVN
ncbi:MAG: tetratricopeptide repeat protein [Saprospiraceae bacterium]|nr:tetratricopeptide repeat protein [Saprospiraceae bacterium]